MKKVALNDQGQEGFTMQFNESLMQLQRGNPSNPSFKGITNQQRSTETKDSDKVIKSRSRWYLVQTLLLKIKTHLGVDVYAMLYS
jgi:hypothetical protein